MNRGPENTWGLVCQKQFSKAGTSNYTPQILWGVIIWPCSWYLLLAHMSLFLMQFSSFLVTQYVSFLAHWGRVMHTCVSKINHHRLRQWLGRRQAIIWTSARILLIRNSETNFSGIFSEIHTFSFKKMHLKMSSANWWQFYLGLSVF